MQNASIVDYMTFEQLSRALRPLQRKVDGDLATKKAAQKPLFQQRKQNLFKVSHQRVAHGLRDRVDRRFVTRVIDTNREFPTINGLRAKGGSMNGPAPVVAGGMLYVASGYGVFGLRPGNVLLAFGPE